MGHDMAHGHATTARQTMRFADAVRPGARVGLKVAPAAGMVRGMGAIETATAVVVAALVVAAVVARIGTARVVAWLGAIVAGLALLALVALAIDVAGRVG